MSNFAPNTEADKAGPSRQQPGHALTSSASASLTLLAPVEPPPRAPDKAPSLLQCITALQERLADQPPAYTCKLTLQIAFFFDGTGNNLDADEGTNKHSNVARLFKAHPDTNKNRGIYSFYIPGIGTYFREIGDDGNDNDMGFGKYGEPRLEQAMTWLEKAIANHPADKILSIKLVVFGFSRGAALARAFVRRVDTRCRVGRNGLAHWPGVNKPCSVRFLGLFDTVASVGLPASASELSLRIAQKWVSLDKGLALRRNGNRTGLGDIAFGHAPGADPTRAVWDGHTAWARNLRIPPIVEKTLHLVSTHEMRNSFPLDTIWDGTTLPPGAAEFVYPGVHSDVGGGYRAGEGGKSEDPVLMLSRLPLRHMYDAAIAQGIPLFQLDNPRIEEDFTYVPSLATRFNQMLQRSGFRAGKLGDALLSHMEVYYRWRFRAIHLKLRAAEKQRIAQREQVFRSDAEGNAAKNREGLKARVSRMESDPARLAAQRDVATKKQAWYDAIRTDPGADHSPEKNAYLAAEARFGRINDAYLRERGKLRALPSHDGSLSRNLDIYDQNLLRDVETLRSLQKEKREPLRPHYQRLLEAWLDEFERGKGLTDPLVIDFFDSFVHDSLAGFAKDATLPSDPRCCYIGGDKELRFADGRKITEPNATSVA